MKLFDRELHGILFALALVLATTDESSDALAQPVFVDRAKEAGLEFVHADGRSGRRYLLESLGAGVALVDVDGDGWLDVYCVSGADLPGKTSTQPPRNALFRNIGNGRFTDITATSKTGDSGYGFGVCAGDYDADGRLDLFVSNFGADVLYRNLGGGAFEDVTEKAGVAGESWSTGAAFLDYDGDGDLDLFVAAYVAYEIKTPADQCWAVEGKVPGYCHPQKYREARNTIWENRGDGTFRDVTHAAGLAQARGKSLGVVCGDYDRDGDTDIFVANDTTANLLFRNSGGKFREDGLLMGIAFSESGRAEAGMGVALDDFDGDGWLDFAVTNFAQESNSLYRNHQGEYFAESSFGSASGRASQLPMGWGTGFFDFDRDGRRDWFVVNGHLQDNIHLSKPDSSYAQHNLLLRGLPKGKFDNLGARAGKAMSTRAVGRGAAFGDIDNDGDIDVVVSNSNSALRLLRCEGESKNHWLTIDLRQAGANRFAIGARVTVRTGDLLLVDEVQSGGSYLSQNDLRLHFGLGTHTKAAEIEVRWPDGHVEKKRDVDANRVLTWTRKR